MQKVILKITYNIKKGINKDKCEDAVLLGTKIFNAEKGVIEMCLPAKVCIGDGVGGNAGGYEASMFLMNQVKRIMDYSHPEKLKIQLNDINSNLLKYANNSVGHELMATTFTGLFFEQDHVLLAHCGNTRAYTLQGSFLKQITEDQTTYQWLMLMDNTGVADYCNKSEIRGAFGGGSEKYITMLIVKKIFERVFPAIILLTSDGIHDYLDIDEIEEIITQNHKAEDKVEQLISEAVNKGSQDDCTAVLIEVDKN